MYSIQFVLLVAKLEFFLEGAKLNITEFLCTKKTKQRKYFIS